MGVEYVLTPKLRRELKKPLGILVKGSFSETMNELMELVARDGPPLIISVGDTVSRNLHQHGLHPRLTIIDNKCMRKSIREIELPAEKIIRVHNPQGTLTSEAIAAVQDAIESKQSVEIIVEGEEDLLTLVAALYAPENAFVVYGQPHEGIVVVKTTSTKKAEIAAIFRAMKKARKTK
jgi:uncharacterized protein (UPF0218 family)